MAVYIEAVILNNLLVNYFLIYAVIITLKVELNKLRIFFSCLIGTVFAVAMPYLGDGGYLFLIKIGLAFLMCAVYAKYKNFKQYLLSLIVFTSYTFLAGGLVIACCGLNYGVNDGFDFLNQNNLVPALGALAGIFVIFTVKKILNYIKNIKINSNSKVIIKVGKKEYECDGFYDSGNKLYDKFGLPAVVLDKNLGKEILKDNIIKTGTLSVKTVGGQQTMKSLEINEIRIVRDNFEEKYSNVTAGISKNKFKNFKILLHSEMC